MKGTQWWLLFGILVAACDHHDQSPEPLRSAADHSSRKHRKGIGLPYVAASSATGESGHQAYRFGETWASSREDIIRFMSLAGWQPDPDYKPSDAVIRFIDDSPGPLIGPVQGTRWEKDLKQQP